VLIAGTILVPAIGASAQIVTTTTITVPTTTTTAAPTTTTTTAAGSLSISAPPSATLSSGTPTNAGSLSAQLGAVTVQDTRTGAANAWTATVTATDFTTGHATANETIGRANVSYWSGAATASSGVGVFTPGQLTANQAQALDVGRTAFTMASGVGTTSVTWNPTITVTIPPSAVVGSYTGTITHSAA
jgi:hypothetical protein